ncbi:MAG: PKD domain-containing protein [Candidatus Bathyarchaeota archaeon]|nr:MAG: PKD domain-containing protein [Candidatus Bathyarchaeota archaeon]
MAKQLLLKLLLVTLLSTNIFAGAAVIMPGSHNPITQNSPRQATKIVIDPANVTADVGQNITITVKIVDVANLKGFTIGLRWGTAVLGYVDHTVMVGLTGGVFEGDSVFELANLVMENASISGAAPGSTYWMAYLTLAAEPFDGNGTAFDMTFEVLRDGECEIQFTFTQMGDDSQPSQDIVHTSEGSYFYRPGLGNLPVADYTFSPDPVIANKTAAFDATTSYDPDGGSITRYFWNFMDGTSLENTTSPMIFHNFTTPGTYQVELTTLDDQGGGSQSTPKHVAVKVVHAKPVANFTVWPDDLVTVINKETAFDASASYDPDPGGSIVEYRWTFGDGSAMNTSSPLINYTYTSIPEETFGVYLVVVDDTDGLESDPKLERIEVVERRDIETTTVSLSPNTVKQGENVAIDVTVTNRGQAKEAFNLTLYYNATGSEWAKVGEIVVSEFPKQKVPTLEFVSSQSSANTIDQVLRSLTTGIGPVSDSTKVNIGTDTGFWTVNPGRTNNDAYSSSLILGTPLSTGGWLNGTGGDPLKINGDFAAGNWAFKLRLYSSQDNVTATVWTRILKSDNPDPHAAGATVTIVKDWTSLFPASVLNTTATSIDSTILVPAADFSEEYLYFEFQLEVTENLAASDADIVFQVGGPYAEKPRIACPAFSKKDQYTIIWNTEFATLGKHVVRAEASRIPHEANITNNVLLSNPVQVTARSDIPPLEVVADVGPIHFGGENASFHVLVSSSGKRVDASLTAFIVFELSVTEVNQTQIEQIQTGLYLVHHAIPVNASSGTYSLVLDAERFIIEENVTQHGTTLKSFLVSHTFDGWNAMLTMIENNTATILTDVGIVQLDLATINATLTSVILGGHDAILTQMTSAKDEVLAEISTDLGSIMTTLSSINATIIDVKGNTAAISSALGDVQTSLGAVESNLSIGIAAASILSGLAAILAVLIFMRVRRSSG